MRLFIPSVFLACVILSQTTFAQEEQIADGARRFAGGYPDASIHVFESVLNPQRLQSFDFAALRFYVAPLFVLESPVPLNPIPTPLGKLLYGFKLVAFTPQSRTDAAKNLSETITDPRSGQKVNVSPANVYDLPHQLVQFRILGLPEAQVNTKGISLDQNVVYNPNEVLTVEIPESRRDYFEALVRGELLQVVATLNYNAKSVSRVQIQISETAVLRAARRRVFDGQGAAYFNAKDLNEIVREALTTSEISFYADPDADAQIVSTIDSFLNSLRAQSYANVAQSLADARNLEAKTWEGPGIQPTDYQPITLLWNATQRLNTTTDYRRANESLRQYYDQNKVGFSVSFKAGYGPFSATIRKGFERLSVNQECFSNQEEFNLFKQENFSASGLEPRITWRGLGLVEARDFESRIGAISKVVSYKPRNRFTQYEIQCKQEYQGTDSTATLNMLDIHRRLATLEKREIKTTSFWVTPGIQSDFDILVTPGRPAHPKRPITQPLSPELTGNYVTAATVERRNNGRNRKVELTIKWPRPFAEGTTVSAFAAIRALDVDGNGGIENTRVEVGIGSVDQNGLVVGIETWEGTELYGVSIYVVAISNSELEATQSLFPLDAAAREIKNSAAKQQVYNLYEPDVLLSGIRTSSVFQQLHGLYPLGRAAEAFLSSPAMLESYGFKRKVVDIVKGSTTEMASAGLYPESAIRNVHPNAPLIAVDPSSGRAELTFGLNYSDTLAPGSWKPLGNRAVWIDEARTNQAFYRVFLEDRP